MDLICAAETERLISGFFAVQSEAGPRAVAGDDGFQPLVQTLPLFGMLGGNVSLFAGILGEVE